MILDNRKVVEAFLATKKPLSHFTEEISSIACIAAQQGNKSLLKALVHRGVDLNTPHFKGLTPLIVAQQNKNQEMIMFINELMERDKLKLAAIDRVLSRHGIFKSLGKMYQQRWSLHILEPPVAI